MYQTDIPATQTTAREAPIAAAHAKGGPKCTHCGESCLGGKAVSGAENFCCLGCQTVYTLLTNGGLSQFYRLASTPGQRVGTTIAQHQWSYLDDEVLQQHLFDFADDRSAKITLHLPTIHCVACVWLLENLFRLQPAIGESRVNFSRREVSLTYDRTGIKLSEIAALLARLGYEPLLTLGEIDSTTKKNKAPWHKRQWLQVGLAGFGFGNIMLLSLPVYFGLDSLSGPWFGKLAGWLGLVLALPVVIYSAADFWRAAWHSLKQKVLTMDVPIALGLAAIYGQSVFEVATGRGAGYCDSLTGLIFFLLCGRIFQRVTFDRLAFDRDYKGFFPLSVLRKTAEGEESVAISQLALGNHLLIRNGELVPADARLITGTARIDYSFVTGESEPVDRKIGEALFAGGRQVGGTIEVETLKPVSESYLTSLWNNEVFQKQPGNDLHSLTNRYSHRFTAAIAVISISSALFWMFVDISLAMKAFTSVLIVACPCALALAAPLTLGTAQRWLAGRNVFVRNAQVIESMAALDTIVFDKTGTLTCPGEGFPAWHGTPLNESELRCILSVARHSTHPLARQLLGAINSDRLLEVISFCEAPGCGIEGRVGGKDICLGSAVWLKNRGASSNTLLPSSKPILKGSSIDVAIDGCHRGFFSLENLLRPEVDGLIRSLKGKCKLVLLSGDNSREEGRFQALLGKDARIEFHQSPFDKLRVIQELQASGRKVMMVGDGLNDAGALKQADVGVAVVEKIGIFSPASDIILDASRLPQIAEALAFSKRAAGVVRTGFLVSGLYNLVGVSIAAAGLLSPLVCAILMPLSSVTVVLYSIGMTRWLAQRTFKQISLEQKPNISPKINPTPHLSATAPSEGRK